MSSPAAGRKVWEDELTTYRGGGEVDDELFDHAQITSSRYCNIPWSPTTNSHWIELPLNPNPEAPSCDANYPFPPSHFDHLSEV